MLKGKENKEKRFEFRMDKEVREKLDKECKKANKTRSKFLRELILNY